MATVDREIGDPQGGEGTDYDPAEAVTAWLVENWDPDLTVGEWWERLGTAGWAAPSLPAHAYGKGLPRSEAVRVAEAIAAFGALGPPAGLGISMAAPTIAAHGTAEQIERYVRAAVTGKAAWCQLFSEPGAGSDLAGLSTRAVRDGDEWVVEGQKVWTSGGQIADFGMLLARTDPDLPKHEGLTWFAFDMHQEGVEVRPLREMTGRALFNEVFIARARVRDDAIVGGLNRGWAVANTTLSFERAALGAGGGSIGVSATPGTVAGDLGKRAGDMARAAPRGRTPGAGAFGGVVAAVMQAARELRCASDPTFRQDLARLYTLERLGRYMGLRQKALLEAGQDLPGFGNLAKLSMSRILRLARDVGLRMLGPRGTLHAYDEEAASSLAALPGGALAAALTEMALFAQAPSIYGGTDEIQHNIIGERVLGLPKEPRTDIGVPFKDLPRNQ